jgi:hypothetical protein
MVRIKNFIVVAVLLILILVAIVVYALVIKAYLFVWFDVPSGKYGEKRFLDIAFVNVACIQSTVWVTGMVQETGEIASMVGINCETVLPRRTAILEVVKINVKQICSSRLVIFDPTFLSLCICQQLSRIYPNVCSFRNLLGTGKDAPSFRFCLADIDGNFATLLDNPIPAFIATPTLGDSVDKG